MNIAAWKHFVLIFMICMCCITAVEADVVRRTIVIEGISGALSARLLTPAILEQDLLTNSAHPVIFYGTELDARHLTEAVK